jgi:Ca-activated chloride channel family protein
MASYLAHCRPSPDHEVRIITSAVGIGDGYDEALLGGMANAGGGQLHDVEHASEIGEVVLGELHEGRDAVLERARLRVTVPASVRAEVIGPWSYSFLPGTLNVTCGTLLPNQTRRIVVRLHCPPGTPGEILLLGVAASGTLPNANVIFSTMGVVEADPIQVGLRLARGRENNAQRRDLDRSLTVLQAWQAAILRKTAMFNRERHRRAARRFIERELRSFQRYATGVPGAEPLVAELSSSDAALRRNGASVPAKKFSWPPPSLVALKKIGVAPHPRHCAMC